MGLFKSKFNELREQDVDENNNPRDEREACNLKISHLNSIVIAIGDTHKRTK